ncbi:right-handed parallel beta-helix repeat-containing protein [Lysinibacillus sp. NPDC096212]|uniref:right-handed parallel beta-helix repeat-containing protein n=1 Tax=Lysinibacillus sp. NPDC096212 TaxID=3364135 RepID=UPI00381122C8
MTVILNSTENPITREERIKINENWQKIMSGYTHLQMQINVLAGGEELEELIRRLNETVENANVAVQEAIEVNNTATQEAIEANNAALQTALDTVSQTLVEVNNAISSANTATSDANAAKQGALDATTQAQTAITTMQSLINNMKHCGTWNDTTQYYKNNMATLNGSTFIALQDSLGKTPPTLPTQSNAYWSIFAEKGAKGDKGEQGAATKILGSLADESELPLTGELGDGYLIKGNLYVWIGTEWENIGTIQGPQGEQGPPGQDADLTEITQTVTNLEQTVTKNQQIVTENLAQKANQTDLESIENELMNTAVNALRIGTNIIADGVTDDTEAVNAFILDNVGKELRFPSGTYLFNSTIVVPSNTRIVGDTAIFKAGPLLAGNKPLLTNRIHSGDLNTYNDKDIYIEGITFEGSNIPRTTSEFVSIIKVSNFNIKRCKFKNILYMGIALAGCYLSEITDCYFTNTGKLEVTSEGGPALWVSSAVDNSISKNITIHKCKFEHLNWSGVYFHVEEGVISDSKFISCKESAIFTNNTASKIRYINNYIYGSTKKNISASGIECGAKQVQVIGNTIMNCQSDGISLTDTQDVIVSDNIVENNGQDNKHFTTACGIGIITTQMIPNQPDHVKISRNYNKRHSKYKNTSLWNNHW